MRIEAQNLTCRRGGRKVFQGLHFTLEGGEILLVAGPNGSGKSSLLRIVAGLREKEGGHFLVNGQAIEDWRQWQQNLHYIGHLDAVKLELTVLEQMHLWAALGGLALGKEMGEAPSAMTALSIAASISLGSSAGRTGCMAALAAYELAAFLERPVRLLSAGQKRRLSLARLLFCRKQLWVLDEPLTALDIRGQELFWQSARAHQAEGGAILMAAHHDVEGARILTLKGTA